MCFVMSYRIEGGSREGEPNKKSLSSTRKFDLDRWLETAGHPPVMGASGKEIKWPRSMSGEIEIMRICLNTRVGKLVNLENLNQINFRSQLNRGVELGEAYRGALNKNILLQGDDALSHLCLPISYHYSLIRAGIKTISQLQKIIEESSLTQIKGIGEKTKERIVQVLNNY